MKTVKTKIVYIVGIQNSRLFKIGISSRADKRLAELQRTSADIFDYSSLSECEAPLAEKLEKELHRRFSAKRTHHEWFQLSTEDLQEAFLHIHKFCSGRALIYATPVGPAWRSIHRQRRSRACQ